METKIPGVVRVLRSLDGPPGRRGTEWWESPGMGVLADRQSVLTCAHVVNFALGLDSDAPSRPEKPVFVTFPLVEKRLAIEANVTAWVPRSDQPSSDLAILTLTREAPEEAGLAAFAPGDVAVGHEFYAYGFRPGSQLGCNVSGSITRAVGDGTVQLNADPASDVFVETGFSGTGVWDERIGTVVGIISQRNTAMDERVAYMTPLAAYRRIWPAFETVLERNLSRFLDSELCYVLDEAQERMGRKIDGEEALRKLFVVPRVARGLRKNVNSTDLAELERRRADGDYNAIDLEERRILNRLREEEDTNRNFLGLGLGRPMPSGRGETASGEKGRPTLPWDEVVDRLHRAVLLGDPGFGKTTLLLVETARRCGESKAWLRDRRVDGGSLRPALFLRAIELSERLPARAGSRSGLEGILEIAEVRHDLSALERLALEEKLRDGSCLVAVDGLDETPPELWKRLEDHLSPLVRHCPKLQVWFTSRFSGFVRAPIRLLDEDHLELLALNYAQIDQAIGKWMTGPGDGQREALAKRIHESPMVREILRSPLLLNLACHLAETEDRGGSSWARWETSGDLIDHFVDDSVRRWGDPDRWGATSQIPTAEQICVFRGFLAELSLRMWRESPHRAVWPRSKVGSWIGELRRAYPALGLRPDLLRDAQKAGLLVPLGTDTPETTLRFSHRSIGEFLAACGLADDVGRLREPAEIADAIDAYSWNPHAERVITFLAGRMGDARPLLDRLREGRRDGSFAYGRSLAAMCLSELRGSALDANRDIVNDVTYVILYLIKNNNECFRTRRHVEHLWRALPSLLLVDGSVRTRFTQGSHSGGGDDPLALIAPTAPPGEGEHPLTVSTLLIRMISHPASRIRMFALTIASSLGPRLDRPDVVRALARMLGEASDAGEELISARWQSAMDAIGIAAVDEGAQLELARILGEPTKEALARHTERIRALWGGGNGTGSRISGRPPASTSSPTRSSI
jgi:hypothetical protein